MLTGFLPPVGQMPAELVIPTARRAMDIADRCERTLGDTIDLGKIRASHRQDNCIKGAGTKEIP